ncbi:hypothetical protein NFI08_21915 [Halomonas sp. EF61]|uniref:hypothetical protein n=1 Tax=Halomonas sp. EF61 TaxID=2950869 RepID=UPI0032DF7A02
MKRTRLWIFGGLAVSGLLLAARGVYTEVFSEMTFVPSRVYPNLYLVRHPVSDQQALHRSVRQKALERMKAEFIGNEDAYRTTPYSLRFYEYTDGGWFTLFGGTGTAYFLNHKEDPGGFSSEEIRLYVEQHIADFDIRFCEGTAGYQGTLTYSWEGAFAGTDIIVDTCPSAKDSDQDAAEAIIDA